MIHKINNDLYCININQPIQKDTTKKINHICILDNENMTNIEIMKSIIHNYPEMLRLYDNYILLDEIQLITTYPKLITTKLNINNIHTEFQKIPFNKSSNKSLLSTTLEHCIKTIKEDMINEVIIFTNYIDNDNNRIRLLLSMLNDHTLTLVVYENTQFNVFTTCKLSKDIEYEKLIKSNKLLHIKYIPNNLIETETKIFGLNSNILSLPNYYNFIPITNNDKTIKINSVTYDLQFIEDKISDNNLLDSFGCIIKYNDNIDDTFIKFKNVLLMNYDLTKEDKNKKVSFYYNYKIKYLNYANNYIASINTTDDNINTIVDYGKKTLSKINKNIQPPKFIIPNMQNIEFEEDENFNNSLEIFVSSITLSNWHDEIMEKSALGILFNYSTNELTKKGVYGFSYICNVTSTFMSIIDFINNAKEYFETNNKTYGDLNGSSIVKVNSTNVANSILPIYINKHHWANAKVYLESLLGIINFHNPFVISKSNINIYYDVFLHMTTMLFQKENMNEKFIQIYFSFFRTCGEICFENKFNFGIKTLMNNFMTNINYRHFKNQMEHNKFFTQILTTGFVINDIKLFLQYLLEESIRVCIKNRKYRYKYLDEIKTFTDNDFDKEFKLLLENINNFIENDIKTFIGFYNIYNIFRGIITKTKSFNQFIKQLDKSYGVLSNELVDYVINNLVIINNPVTFKYFYNIMGIDYDENKIMMYILQSIYEYREKNNNDHIDIINTDINKNYIINYVNNKLLKCN